MFWYCSFCFAKDFRGLGASRHFREMLLLLSAFIYLINGYGQAIEDAVLFKRIPDLVSHLCPGSNVCATNRSSATADEIKFSAGRTSCCTECSCSAECSKTGDCCFPDQLLSKRRFREEVQQLVINNFTCMYPFFPTYEYNLHHYQSYLMISSVNKHNDIKQQSNTTCGNRNVAPWGSLYPVYSTKSRQIYKNEECAREDGEDFDGLIHWDAYVSCKNVKSTAKWLDTNSILNGCKINFIFPGDYDELKPFKCNTNLIDTCPDSNDFLLLEGTNTTKDDIRTLCTKSGLVSVYRVQKMYANVFCTICNTRNFYRTKTCGKKMEGKATGSGFLAVIDYKFIAERRETNFDQGSVSPLACSHKSIKECRPIFCPNGQVRDRRGQCAFPSKIWLNQNYVVHINLTLEKNINVSEVFKEGIEIIQLFESTWLRSWSIRIIYYRRMNVQYMTDNFVIALERELSNVNPRVLMRQIKNMMTKSWSLHLHNDTEVLKSSNISKQSVFDFVGQDSKRTDNAKNVTVYFEPLVYETLMIIDKDEKSSLAITKLYICDQIELEQSEYLLDISAFTLYSYITESFYYMDQFEIVSRETPGEKRARICIDDALLFISTNIAQNVGYSINVLMQAYWYLVLIKI